MIVYNCVASICYMTKVLIIVFIDICILISSCKKWFFLIVQKMWYFQIDVVKDLKPL